MLNSCAVAARVVRIWPSGLIRYAATVAAIPADCIRDSYVSATQVPSHTRNLISAAVFSGVLFCDMLIELCAWPLHPQLVDLFTQ